MIDLVQYRTSIGLFASITSRISKKRNTKLSFKTVKNSSKPKAKIKINTKDEDVFRGQSFICLQLLTVVLCFHLVCSNQFLDTNTVFQKYCDIFCGVRFNDTTLLHCNAYGSVECWEILHYGDLGSNNKMLSVNYSDTLSYSDLSFKNRHHVKYNNLTLNNFHDNRSEHGVLLPCDICDEHSYFICQSVCNGIVMIQSLEMCPYPGTCCYLLGNKGMHRYNGNPPTGLNLTEEDIKKQQLCVLLVDGGSQALRYTISRIVLDMMLQNVDGQTRHQLCDKDKSLLYPAGSVLPSLDGLSLAGLDMVWTKALQQRQVTSGTAQDMEDMIYDYLVCEGLDIQLKSKKQRVQELNNSNKLLSREQWDILYPRLNITVDFESFDMTLLCFVILNVFQFKPTSRIWNQDPPAGDVGIGDDILRLRIQRNKLAHSSSSGMYDNTFRAAWTEIRDVLVRLKPGQEFYDRIQQLHDCQLVDPEKAAEIEQLIVYWMNEDKGHLDSANSATRSTGSEGRAGNDILSSGLNLNEETIKKQRLCVLLVDVGSQALRYTISRIVLDMMLQNVDGQTRHQLCDNDKSLLYPARSVLPSLDGLSLAGLDMVWTKALQQRQVTSGTAQDMEDMIYDYLVNEGLDIQLKNEKQRVQELDNKNKLLSREQWDILYPRLNITVDFESFDITLLCFVILNVYQFKPTSRIWNQDPPAGDICIGDDILRLRIQRNKLVHSSSSGMDNNTFQTAWTEIRDVLVRLKPGQEFYDRIQQLHDCQLVDPEKAAEIEQLIVDWMNEDKGHLDSANSATRSIASEGRAGNGFLSSGAAITHADEDRPKYMLITVEAWRKEDIYVTKFVKAVKERILSKGCVCVIGVPGAGKSTALHHAALCLENVGFTVYFISGPQKFLENYYDSNKKQVFVLDDALGVYSVDQGRVKSWQERDEEVRNVLGTNTKLLVSIRTQIFRHETIRDKNIVFLEKSETTDHVNYSDADYKLGLDDMIGMMTHYMRNKGTDSDNIDNVIRRVWGYTEKEWTEMTEEDRQRRMSWYTAGVEFADCFPLMCKVFVNTVFAKQNPRTFFENPFPALTNVFQNIKTDNKHQFCALVLCTMFDGKLTDDLVSPLSQNPLCDNKDKLDKDKVELRNYIMATYKLKCPDDLEDLKSALNSLTGVYILHIGETYKISHAVFHDIVTYLFNDPLFVFKYGTREFIRDRVRLNKGEQQHDPYFIIYSDDTNIERLVDRLLRDLKSDIETGAEIKTWYTYTCKGGKFVAMNPNIHDDRFYYDLESDKEPEAHGTWYTWTGAKFITENPNIQDDRLIACLRSKLTDREQTGKKGLFRRFYHRLRSKLTDREQTDKKMLDDLFTHCMKTVWCNRHTYKHGDVPSYKLIELCLQREADYSNMYIDNCWYPLHLSVITGNLQLIQLLLQHGADKRRVDWCGDSVLHWVCKYTSYNRLELIKLLTQDGDLSVVKFITSDKQTILQILHDRDRYTCSVLHERILEALNSDSPQLEEVLSDNSVKVLTTDKHRIKHFVENCKGKLNLVKPLHDNILTYVDTWGRNILHHLADDSKSTSYVLGLMSDTSQAVNQRNCEGKTPYWYVFNKQFPSNMVRDEEKLNDKDREDMIQLYKDNHAILFDSSDDSSEEDISKNVRLKIVTI